MFESVRQRVDVGGRGRQQREGQLGPPIQEIGNDFRTILRVFRDDPVKVV